GVDVEREAVRAEVVVGAVADGDLTKGKGAVAVLGARAPAGAERGRDAEADARREEDGRAAAELEGAEVFAPQIDRRAEAHRARARLADEHVRAQAHLEERPWIDALLGDPRAAA